MVPPEDDDVFQAFVEEAKEHVSTIERQVLALESQGTQPDQETIGSLFRAAHSTKGTASFFSVVPVTRLAHSMENVLGRIRAHDLVLSAQAITLLLEATDLLGQMLRDIANIGAVDPSKVIEALERLAAGAAERASQHAGSEPRSASAPKSDPSPEVKAASNAPPASNAPYSICITS